MIIKNGSVFGEDGKYTVRDIYIENHKIVASREEVTDTTEIDAAGKKVIPGLVDIHSHGAYGHDFSDGDAEGLEIILKYQRRHGITSYCPTSMTLPKEQLLSIFSTAVEAEGKEGCASVAGINMEGPFIDKKKKGAHVEEYIVKPDVDFFRECNDRCNHLIRLVTLAPTAEGALEFIDQLKDEVCISLGHTSANYEEASEAIRRGAHHVTHLYNAMQPLSHREPGLIGAALDDENCVVELISDGIHIHPAVVRATFQMFGPERVALISDSMMATGMENGTYELGGQRVTVKDQKAVLDNGTIAGSATNLFDCMRKAISFGVPEAEAIFAATRNPAASIGIYDKTGSVAVGKEADLLIADQDLNLIQVI